MNLSNYAKGSIVIKVFLGISVLAVILLIAYMIWNPSKRAEDERNRQRVEAVNTILEKVIDYTNTQGNIPNALPITSDCASYGNEICNSDDTVCDHKVQLSFLDSFVVPVDPSRKNQETGYYISQDGQGNITVCAPYAERNVNISVSKFAFSDN